MVAALGADCPPVFIGDQFTIVRKRVRGGELFTATCATHNEVLFVTRQLSTPRALLGFASFVTILMGCVFASAALAPPNPNSWPRLGVVAIGVLVGGLAGIVAMAHIIPRQDLAVRAGGAAGDVVLRILDAERLSLRTSPYSVLAGNGIAIGTLTKSPGATRTTWSCLGTERQSMWTATDESVGRAAARTLVAGLLGSGGHAVQAGASVRYTLRTPDGKSLGVIHRNALGPGSVTLDLTPDAELVIDRRLALALAIKMSVAHQA